MPFEEQVAVIFAVTNGLMDAIDVARIKEWEEGFLDHLRTQKSDLLKKIRESGKLEDDTVDALKKAIEGYAI